MVDLFSKRSYHLTETYVAILRIAGELSLTAGVRSFEKGVSLTERVV